MTSWITSVFIFFGTAARQERYLYKSKLTKHFFTKTYLACQTLNLPEPGSDYEGQESITASGRVCQSWDQQEPHQHGKPSFSHNYCRNPDGEPKGVWCYTTDPKVRFEYCQQIPGIVKVFLIRSD